MFVFNRSAAAVILPIALLLAAAYWSNREATPRPEMARAATPGHATVAQVETPARRDR